MRRMYFAIALGALGLGVLVLSSFSPTAHADSDVLLPSDSNGSENPPADLGLQPATNDNPSSVTTPAPQQMPDESLSLPVIDPANETSATAPTAGASGSSTAPYGAPAGMGTGTHVIKLPYMDPASSPAPGASPPSGHDLAIDIDKSSKLGDNDLAGVKRTLGFSPNDAQKHCHFSVSGTITTDKKSFPYQMSPHLMHTIVHLDGKPSAIIIMGAAICDMLPVPDNLGIVMQVDDKYSVPLQFIGCKPPPENAQHFDIKYAGDGNAKCSSQ